MNNVRGLRALIIIFLIITCTNMSYALSDLDEDTEKSEDIQSEQINLFENFKEISIEELMNHIENDTILGISHDDTAIYIITDANEKFYTNECSTDILSYIKMHGYEVNRVQLLNSPSSDKDKETAKKSVNYDGYITLVMIAVVGLLCVAGYKKVNSRSSLVVYNSSTSASSEDTQNKPKSKENEVPAVKFDDVEGVDELKEDVFRIVDCLKNPSKYERLGARTPRGIILYGPPGTGKTLLAKAIAGEAGVPFIPVVGSDFVEKYVGVGAKRVRELYKKARQQAPSIVFIDEVDAVAARRGEDDNSELDQTINALLSELDGFSDKAKVVTICATNRLDLLDSAFTRAGRFDLKLAVGLPDKKSRLAILKIHSKNKLLGEDVSLESIANKTSGFSGAELEALLNESALLAAGKDRNSISTEDIDDAYFKIVMQGNKKRREGITEFNKIVAWHEAGHTLATKLLTDDSVTSVTIIGSSSGAGGVTFRQPKDEGLQSKKYLKSSISIMYAGRAAEEVYLGNDELITNGASQDIKQATGIIKQYLALYGMGNLGMLDLTQLKADFGTIINEASKLSDEMYKKTKELLVKNKATLEDLAMNLLDKETLEEKDIDSILKKHKLYKA